MNKIILKQKLTYLSGWKLLRDISPYSLVILRYFFQPQSCPHFLILILIHLDNGMAPAKNNRLEETLCWVCPSKKVYFMVHHFPMYHKVTHNIWYELDGQWNSPINFWIVLKYQCKLTRRWQVYLYFSYFCYFVIIIYFGITLLL